MTTVLLLRHGRSTANAGGVLAGWTPDVHLHEDGEKQGEALAERLAKVPLTAIVSSPLERCRETVAPLLAARDLELTIDDRFGEVRYGDWTGVELKKLARGPAVAGRPEPPERHDVPRRGRRVDGRHAAPRGHRRARLEQDPSATTPPSSSAATAT